MRENAAVNGSPENTTVIANAVTNCPATGMEIFKSLAKVGIRPIIMNSVVTMTKAASERMATAHFSTPVDFISYVLLHSIEHLFMVYQLFEFAIINRSLRFAFFGNFNLYSDFFKIFYR
ncbi:hypothetical protein D3C79_787040 [compost metagenome]